MNLKSIFSFLFLDELQELESCKEEIEELKKINELLKSNEPVVKKVITSIRPFNSKFELREWLINNNI